MQADLRLERESALLLITLDRPAARNALNRATRVALVERLAEAEADPTIRSIVITGADPAFSSGVDAKELLSDPDYVPPAIDPATRLRSMTTPTIAAVNGSCVSGGLEIALACSFVIASEVATFADTHARIGLTPGWGLSAELPATIGVARARQMTLTGMPIDAEVALRWGLVNEVVEHDALLGRARQLAHAMAAVPAGASANAVDLYRNGRDRMLGPDHAFERQRLAEWSVARHDSLALFGDR